MNNIKIKIIEGKDVYNKRIPKKYKGSLDWSQEVDYIFNDPELGKMIKLDTKIEVSNEEKIYEVFDTEIEVSDDGEIEFIDILEEYEGDFTYYTDDIITVTYKYNVLKELEGFIEFAKDKLSELEKLKEKKDNYKEIKELEKEIENLKRTYISNYRKDEIEEIKNEINQYKEDIETIKDNYRESREIKVSKSKIREEDWEEIKEIKEKINDLKSQQRELKNEVKCERNDADIKKDKLRLDNYVSGFELNGIKYKRYKRSSGSARVGKVLFINEKYKDKMINWSFCDIPQEGQHDIASLEAYISLPLSSAINKFELSKENILVIEDVESIFKDTVYASELINEVYDNEIVISGDINTTKKRIEIKNKIHDGQSLLDQSIFLNLGYFDKADLQIRNKWFKGTGVRCDIQSFFKLMGIEKISQLNGLTMAKNVEDIKLITTPSSLKFMKLKDKFEDDQNKCFEYWADKILNNWYVCKYEKPQHHFNGMVQTHYQLVNSLGMKEESFREFLKPSIEYIEKLKNDDDVFIKHIKIKNNNIEDELSEEVEKDKNYILTMLKLNRNFIHTAAFKNFRKKAIQSYINNIKAGHVLITGNYSIVASNVLEMLFHSVGKLKETFDDEGNQKLYIDFADKEIKLEGYNVITNKFEDNEEILAVRSPQPSMSNISVYKNIKNKDNEYYKLMSQFFYLDSNEVIYTNSINCNRMEKMSSEDFDGDSELISNNKILVEYAKELQDKFLVNNDLTSKRLELKEYTGENLSTLDINCSQNKIGEIINLAQSLNSAYWKGKKDGKSEEWLEELYKTICTLNTLSCIEIDRAKKISPISSTKELKKIRNTIEKNGYLEVVTEEKVKETKEGTVTKEKKHQLKPAFLKHCNEYKINSDNKKSDEFIYYDYGVGMDLMIKVLNEELDKIITKKRPRVSMVELLVKGSVDKKKENRRQITAILDKIDMAINEMNRIWASNEDTECKLEEVEEIDFSTIGTIISKVTPYNIARIIYKCEKYIECKEVIEKLQKKLDKEKELQLDSETKEKYTKKIKDCNEYMNNHKTCRYYATILRLLFKSNPKVFLSIFKIENTKNTLKRVIEPTDDETITLYGVDFIKQAS